MTCINPMAPAPEVMRESSALVCRPPGLLPDDGTDPGLRDAETKDGFVDVRAPGIVGRPWRWVVLAGAGLEDGSLAGRVRVVAVGSESV